MKKKNWMSSYPRRSFLKALGIGGGAVAMGQFGFLDQLATAQAQNLDAPDRYYIFCYFGGGWDVLLSLDPRDQRDFPSSTESLRETRIQPGYDTQQRPDLDVIRTEDGRIFGPFIGELQRHFDKLTVVRGLNMETLSHTGGRRRFITGKAPSGTLARGSSASTWLASHLGANDLIPNLSLRIESYNQGLPNYASALRVSNVPDLLRALRPAQPSLHPLLSRQIDATLRAAAACPNAKISEVLQKAEYARGKSADVTASSLAGFFDFGSRSEEMDALRDRYNFSTVNSSPSVSAALAAQAIMQGVSRCVSVGLVGGLDSHAGTQWQQTHGPNQEAGFNAVATLVDHLESTPYDAHSTWLDHTTIIGFSEFSRTPMLNLSGGRDHHITNSCFLLGGGVRGGQVIGATTNVAMQSQNISLATGLPDPDGEVIRPEHVLRSLFDEVGIDNGPDLRVRGLDRLIRS